MSDIKPLHAGTGRRRELDPAADRVQVKGVVFEGDANYLAEKLGDILSFKKPDFSQAIAYLSNGNIDTVTFYIGATQSVSFRRAQVTMAYNSALYPTSETWRIYSLDGTTLLRTITLTYTYNSNFEVTSIVEATT